MGAGKESVSPLLSLYDVMIWNNFLLIKIMIIKSNLYISYYVPGIVHALHRQYFISSS